MRQIRPVVSINVVIVFLVVYKKIRIFLFKIVYNSSNKGIEYSIESNK